MTGMTCMMAGGGQAALQVSITDKSAIKLVADPGTATATYSVHLDGTVKNHVPTSLEIWLLQGVNSDYEVRATLASGDTPSGTLATWLLLSTTRSWSLTQSVAGTKTCNLTIEIRRVSDSVVLDTATATITATVEV